MVADVSWFVARLNSLRSSNDARVHLLDRRQSHGLDIMENILTQAILGPANLTPWRVFCYHVAIFRPDAKQPFAAVIG